MILSDDGFDGIWEAAKALGDEALEKIGYVLKDISGDEVPELLIGSFEKDDNAYTNNEIYLIYTLQGEKPEIVLYGWNRNAYSLKDDNSLFYQGSSGAAMSAFGIYHISNDGEYINTLGHPSFNIRKRYHVRLDGELTDGEIGMLKKGISDNGELLKPDNIVSLGECLYEFTLNEGRNREIRRMAARCGRQVRRLIRVSIGKLRLGKLPPGQWRDLTEEEIGQTLSQDIS